VNGYADRVNHALAYAVKHHDQQVRKGSRMPYDTHAANVALILTRYGRDEDTVVAGILFHVVEDACRDQRAFATAAQRVADKFGDVPLRIAQAVAERALDDDDVELTAEERRGDVVRRLSQADDAARWVFAADKVHAAGTLLADLRRTSFPDAIWSRSLVGRERTVDWFRQCVAALARVGFNAPIADELRSLVSELEATA
jgi:(p)ppGpp synthase/HD superfamily hydrolase